MRLNKLQAQAFERYRQFRRVPPSFARELLRHWWYYLFFVLLALGTIALGFAMDAAWVGAFAAGMAVGIFVSHEGAIRVFGRLWPALEAVLDWDKIDQMLAERTARLQQAKSQRESPAEPPPE